MTDSVTQINGVIEESDLASLQQLSTGFESFNQVITDNIARAKTIIQEAAAARAKATQDIADERARFEQEMADARAAFEAEAATEQARLDGQRAQLLAAAQLVINNEWPEPATPLAPVALAAAPAPVKAVVEPVVEAIAAEVVGAAPEEPAVESIAAQAADTAEPVEAAVPAEASAPVEASGPAVAEAPVSTEPTRTTVIVHGIHKPAVATGLQRFLLGQPGITGVEPREFAEGILRLQVRGTVPISEGLFAGWSDGEGMTVIQRVPQTVEVILPTAS